MTTEDYLTQLQQDKSDLVDNLTTKGISGLTGDETFTELVPEVLNIPSGETTKYLIQVIDYDNTILKSEELSTGATFTLPTPPTHDRLLFQEWQSPVTIENNTIVVGDSDINIGVTYTTISGLSEFDFVIPDNLKYIELKMNGTKNWGDGSSNTSISHNYSSAGEYIVTCDGTEINNGSSENMFGASSYLVHPTPKNIRLTNITNLKSGCFNYCYDLETLTLSNDITNIENSNFSQCYSLKNITFPNSILDYSATSLYFSCYSLKTIILPKNTSSFQGSSVYSLENITLPNGINKVTISSAKLKNLVLPNSVTNANIQYCNSLKSITVPTGLETLNISYNYTLEKVIVPDNNNIHTFSSSSCYNLKTTPSLKSLTSISSQQFSSCYNLKNIVLPDTINSTISNSPFQYCQSLESITIPDGITSMSGYTFNSCYNLKSVTLPSSITSIGQREFENCYNLKNIIIPSGITTIPNYLFNNCYSLKSVIFLGDITSVGNYIFGNIRTIEKVDFRNCTQIPTLDQSNAFNGNNILKIIVPDNLYEDWIVATNWSTYANQIVKASDYEGE